MSAMNHVKFCGVTFAIDVLFWESLREAKINLWRLDEVEIDVVGEMMFMRSISGCAEANDVVRLGREALNGGSAGMISEEHTVVHNGGVVRSSLRGKLINFNSLKRLEDATVRRDVVQSVVRDLILPLCLANWGTIEEECVAWSQANFTLLRIYTFVDAKSYRFYHKEVLPVLVLPSPCIVHRAFSSGDADLPIAQESLQRIRDHAFAIAPDHSGCIFRPFLVGISHDEASEINCEAVSFAALCPHELTRITRECDVCAVCFIDFSADPSSVCWPVRNMLLCLRVALPNLSGVNLLALRGGESILFMSCQFEALSDAVQRSIKYARDALGDVAGGWTCASSSELLVSVFETHLSFLRPVGVQSKSAEVVDLARLLDPRRRAEIDSRMNLELMRWRVLPALDLSGLASARVLLLGMGTLGCHVARNLLMWGVRHMTLVDRGHVSYSNLARQSLFCFDDAKEGRRKVDAAAAALRSIIPSVDAIAAHLSIPMPGHTVGCDDYDNAAETIKILIDLITAHDVVFLLTDSRESRWLPSVIASSHSVPVINVAIGFDTYVVMRHGIASSDQVLAYEPNIVGEALCEDAPARDCPVDELACYFCSDIVGPMDSMTMRTLDQQCTVTRPAVASIASAIAVEVLAGLYQHPLHFRCPGYRAQCAERQEGMNILGALPQQIRGSVFSHSVSHLHGNRNPYCTACSNSICEQFRKDGVGFLLQCINNPDYIEAVCGIKLLKSQWEQDNEIAEWSLDNSADD